MITNFQYAIRETPPFDYKNINDEIGIEFTISNGVYDWRIYVEARAVIQQRIGFKWEIVAEWSELNSLGGWKFDIDGSNNLAVEQDDSGWKVIIGWDSESGGSATWRFYIKADKSLYLQQYVGSAWVDVAMWYSLI